MTSMEEKEFGVMSIVDKNGKLAPTISKKATLPGTTINILNSKLGSKKSYGNGTAACYDPHLGFVYYLKNKIVAHVSICLECNRLNSSIDIPAQKQGKVGEGNEIYYISDGLSNSFRKFLTNLLIKYRFSHRQE